MVGELSGSYQDKTFALGRRSCLAKILIFIYLQNVPAPEKITIKGC